MADITGGSLGKSRLDLEVNLSEFDRNMQAARGAADRTQTSLDALAEVSRIAKDALGEIKMTASQAAESKASAEGIISGVRGISEESRVAAHELDKVKLSQAQAAESKIAAEEISGGLDQVSRNARQASRDLTEVRLAGGRNGAGVGIFGSGFGRIGLLGAAVGLGAVTTPAAGPAAAGLLAAIPVLASTAVGALGTVALAFDGVAKAIGGDKKAFDDLGPAAQAFTLTVRSLDGEMDKLRQVAGANLFPGLTEALHSALSPGTVNAITHAVAEFGRAIGEAGAAWGRYFGSAEFQSLFGPLMQAGARNLSLLADAALQLFDAVGTLGRAAIPFTSWMTAGIDKAAQLADSWLHAKDASGALSGAMSEAEVSLRLVGDLLGALLKAVGALGVALYPVAKVAVKDLTDGLNALAGIIQRNQKTIRDIVGGALAALVSAVKLLTPIVGALAKALVAVAHAVGGWKVAFEVALAAFGASQASALIGRIAKVGAAAETTAAEVGGLRAMLLSIGAPEVLAALAAAYGAYKLFSQPSAKQIAPGPSGVGTNIVEASGHYYIQAGPHLTPYTGPIPGGGYVQSGTLTTPPGPPHGIGVGGGPAANGGVIGTGDFSDLTKKMRDTLTALATRYGTVDLISGYRSQSSQDSLWDASVRAGHPGFMPNGNPIARPQNRGGGGSPHTQGIAADATIMYQGKRIPISSLPPSILSAYGLTTVPGDVNHVQLITGGSTTTPSSLFGTPPPFTKNLGAGRKPKAPPLIPQSLQDAVSKYRDLAKNLNDTGAQAKKYLEDEAAALEKERAVLRAKPQTDAVKKALTQVENNLRDVQTKIKDAIVITGAALLPVGLRTRLAAQTAKFTADTDLAQVLTGQAADAYQKTLLNDLNGQVSLLQQEQSALRAKLATSSGKQKKAVQQELDAVTKQLGQVQDQVLQSLQSTVQTLQSKVSSLFQQVTSELDAQFEAQTQAMLAAASAQFFQGIQTPEEAAYAAMQRQDQVQQLQDALAQAKTPAELAAAQRAIQEDQAQQEATASRTRADTAYAEAVRQITAQRTAEEDAMNKQLALLSDGFANGTASLADLQAVADAYGVQIDTTTIPDFTDLSTAAGQLIQAFKDLADYIAKITGTSSTKPSATPPGSDGTSDVVSALGTRPLPGHPVPLASGGIVLPRFGGTVARIGEAGVPEAVIPLPSLSTLTRGGSGDVVLMVDGRELGRASIDAISRDRVGTLKLAKAVGPAISRVVSVGS